MPYNFALIGCGGYVAPRHMKAIKTTENHLAAALDRGDSVGVLDSFSYDTAFFTEFERFDRHAEKLRRLGDDKRIHYVSICSPNYLHDAHIRFALRIGADAVCEKPLVLNPWNLDALQEIEAETGRKVYNILQLRVHPSILELKKKIDAEGKQDKYHIDLSYITSRGRWYFVSWKGDLPEDVKKNGNPTYRSITVDGEEIEFSGGFTDLHTLVYQDILAGNGYGIDAARPSLELVSDIRHKEISIEDQSHLHPFV